MRKFLTIAPLMLAACSMGADLPVAKAQADIVHKLLANGQCAQIRDKASSEFQKATPVQNWAGTCAKVANGLGAFKSAAETGFSDQYTTDAGHIITLSYDATFEKGEAKEQFVLLISGGQARIGGYHIQSDIL